MSVAQEPRGPTNAEEEKRTGYLELFFDLVFVFAFTQVTSLVVEDTSAPAWRGQPSCSRSSGGPGLRTRG